MPIQNPTPVNQEPPNKMVEKKNSANGKKHLPRGKRSASGPGSDWLMVATVSILTISMALLVFIELERRTVISQKQRLEQVAQSVEVNPVVRQDDITAIEEAYLSEEEVIAFIQTMDRVRSSFASFELQFTSDVPQGTDPRYLSVTIIAEGTPDSMLQFLHSLFASEYFLKIDEYEMGKGKNTASESKLTLKGKLYISDK
ncbi:MAG TPA: hypothetical protein VJL83_05410 [Patescibacteria group bacterium]|nr:hypothetical protein [Patescibacteria group bacterium]